jgi:hypothetical protein
MNARTTGSLFGLPTQSTERRALAEIVDDLRKDRAAMAAAIAKDKAQQKDAPELATLMREIATKAEKGTSTMAALTIITSEGPLLTKTWRSPTEKPAPVKLPYRCRFEERESDGLAGLEAILREIAGDPRKAIIRGRLKQGFDPNGWHRRLSMPCPKTGDPATVEDVPRNWVMLDIDDPPLSNVDELQNRLPPELRGVNYVGQLSSSTGHPILGSKLKMHTWFLLNRALSSAECRAWLGSYNGIDVSMLTAVGIHFTAAPVIGA